MNRCYFFATLAFFAIVALGCTREKPVGPNSAPPPDITTKSTPALIDTLSAAVNPTIAPATRITSTISISATAISAASTSVSPTLALPSGIFSQPPPINPTIGAPSPPAAASATPSSAATALSIGPRTYTVQWGDWLSKIARQFGVTNEALMAANVRLNPNLLVPGQVLTIPGPGGTIPPPAGAPPTPAGEPTTYTVQRGDWFYTIARKFGATVEALQAANPGINPNLVFQGQVLNIPGTGTAPPPSATLTPVASGPTPTTGPIGTPVPKLSRYTVQAGETLYSIALQFNTTIYALQIANHLASPHFIYPGQVLVIPK